MSDPLAPEESVELLGREWSVADLVDHLLNRGVVVSGSATISVAGIDLMYLGLQLVFSSVENLQRGRRTN